MNKFKVLIPLDGSTYAEHALAYLPQTSRIGNVDLTLLSVVDTQHQLSDLEPDDAREQNLLDAYLVKVAQHVAGYALDAHKEIRRGNPAEVITEIARREGTDLLLLSTHGRTGWARFHRGSVADKVIRMADCPVLAVGPRAMEPDEWKSPNAVNPIRRILIPLDGSPEAESAIPEAKRFAEALGSKLYLLRAMLIPLLNDSYAGASSYLDVVLTDLINAGKTYLDDVLRRHDLPSSSYTEVRVGTANLLIESQIKANDIDLVVMTSHGRGGVTRVALGSVTDRTIGQGPPVLIVKTREGSA